MSNQKGYLELLCWVWVLPFDLSNQEINTWQLNDTCIKFTFISRCSKYANGTKCALSSIPVWNLIHFPVSWYKKTDNIGQWKRGIFFHIFLSKNLIVISYRIFWIVYCIHFMDIVLYCTNTWIIYFLFFHYKCYPIYVFL